ncbi:MAG: hypothetical protein JSU85_15915 [Candidatus Zixiibacteriota bacterium]|nr:MAG: hypothetical protein JSU85_15915 [candidate division Zixibacteria bacterium]
MKKTVMFTLTLGICFMYSTSSGETVYFPDIPGSGFELLEQSEYGVRVKYSINELFIDDLVVDGRTMKTIQVPGIFLPNNEGAPNLPGIGRMIAIPRGSVAGLRIEGFKTEIMRDIDLAPAPQIPFDTDDSPLKYVKDESIYSVNQDYPAEPVLISDPAKLRGVDYVILGITPFQYNPVTRDLIIYKEISVNVDFTGGSGQFGENRLRNRFWEPILSANLINYNILPKVDFNQIDPNPSETDDFEYVIIVPDDPDFITWADTIKNWRTLQGIRTGVVNLSDIGGNTTTAIENYINNAYNTWDIPPASVLLLSDYQNSGLTYGITSPMWDNYCVSDNIYGDVDNDDLPDVVMARITAQDPDDLSLMINKFLDYERNPPTSPDFYDHPITAGGWQTERWFILCTEICRGFMSNVLGKNPVREYAIYDGTPGSVWSTNANTYMLVDYFGPNGLGYIPATPAHLTDWGANATRINNDINSGAFVLLHRDHGSETGWGEPDYHIGDLAGLNNTMLPHVFTINCLTGRFDYGSQVFTEAFHRMQYGALSLTAASEISYSFVNDTYIFGIWDYMWPNFDPGYGNPGIDNLNPCFANASGKHYLQASNWPYNPQHKVYTHHLFHHHGDAFTTVYSEVPLAQTVVHDPVLLAGPNFFTVTAQPGAMVGLTVNGDIIGTGLGTGSPESIPIEPQIPGYNMIVTATLPNYYRYEATIPIITTSGAYVIYDSSAVDDASGNGNGVIEFGENINLGVQLENVGSDTAYGVTAKLRSSDIYITLTDSSQYYGDIADGETSYIAGAFAFDVSVDVPDNHNTNFEVEVSDANDSVWTSYFNLRAYAPELVFIEVLVDDAAGNGNGILEGGETADMIVTLENTGGSDALTVTGLLSEDDDLVDITDANGSFGDIIAGGNGDNSADPFLVVADTALPMGHSIYFDLDLTASGGYSASAQFILKTVQTFEYDDGGLRATNDWEWGTPQNYGPPSAYSGTKCWGTVIDGYRTAGGPAPNGFIYSNLNFYVDIAASASMSFYHWYHTSGSTYDSINVKINDGSGWQFLYTNYGENAGWELLNIDLSSFSGLAEISLEYFSRSSIIDRPGWYIDDLALLGCSMWFPTDDVAAISVDNPYSLLFAGVPYDIVGTCENFGSDPQTFDVTMTVSDSITHTVHYADTTRLSLDPNVSQQVTFDPFSPLSEGVYEFTLAVDNPGDTNPLNDTAKVYLIAYQHFSEGGPDNFGYRWIDNFSQYPQAPTFDYIDLTSSPSAIVVGSGSGNYGEFPVGFRFEFYGVDYTTAYINGYGYLSFGNMYSSSTNDCPMPNSSTPNEPLIAGFWDYGYCNSSYDGICLMETFGAAPDRYTVIQYHNWRRSNVNLEWEIILHENGDIIYQYLDVDEGGSFGQGQSAAVGLEDYTLTGAGISYLCNDDNPGNRLIDSLAIKWYTPVYAHDICVEEFISPYGSGIINDPFTPEVLFENNGTSNETDVPVRLLIDPGAYDDQQIIATFNSGANIPQQFAQFTPTTGGVYTLKAISELVGDEDPGSDTLAMLFTAYDDILNFETGNGGLIGTNEWEWGAPSGTSPPAYSGVNLWGTVLTGIYPAVATISNLDFQINITGAGALVDFMEYRDMSSASGYARVFADSGIGYELLDERQGNPEVWEPYSIDLSAYSGIVNIRLQFEHSTYVGAYTGWYIDDLALSNCLIVAPEIEVTPVAISGEAYSGFSDADTITISNTGDGTLNYTINCVPDPMVTRNNGKLETLYDTGDFKVLRRLAGYYPVEDKLKVENLVENTKGEPYFLPVPLSIGGPDAFGYTWIDSDEPGGPAYDWIDISSVGIPIPLSDDDNEGPFPLEFAVSYYGNLFSQVYVCSNGWVSFTSNSTSLSNTTLPSSGEPNNTLSMFWDDLNPASGGTVYYYADAANNRFIVSYDGVPHYSNNGSLYFQVIINADGSILYQYNTMNHGGHTVSASIGTENNDGTIGLEYDYNSNPPAIHDNLTILFQPPTFWFYSDVNSGSIAPGGGPDPVEITMDALELTSGVYTGNVQILSNDPDESIINVPVTFTVSGCDYVVGDVNGSDVYSGFDITYSVAYLKGGPEPLCDSCECLPHSFFWTCGDVNADCVYNGLDISFGVSYFKYGTTEPMPCPDCPPPGISAREIKKTETLDVFKGKTKSRKAFEKR